MYVLCAVCLYPMCSLHYSAVKELMCQMRRDEMGVGMGMVMVKNWREIRMRRTANGLWALLIIRTTPESVDTMGVQYVKYGTYMCTEYQST